MKCPSAKTWNLVVMDLLTGEEGESLLTHARHCSACESAYKSARRAHTERTRMYEVFDRDHDVLREQMMAALPDHLPQQSQSGGLAFGWGRLGDMVRRLNTSTNKRTAAVLAPAACIAIVILIVLSNSPKHVFADALARFREAHTIACRVTTTIKIRMEVDPSVKNATTKLPGAAKLKPTETVRHEKLYLSDIYGVRRDTFEEGVMVRTTYVSGDGFELALNRTDQTYEEFDVDDDLRELVVESPGPDVHFMSLAQNPDRLLRGVRELALGAEHELDRERTDEGELIEYAIPAEQVGLPISSAGQANRNRAALWVDSESGDVVRLVFHSTTAVPGTRAVPLKASFTMTIVYDRFEFGPSLEENWFTAIVPNAYTPLAKDGLTTVAHMPNEADLLESLRVFAEIAERYPSSLSAMDASYEVAFVLGAIQANALNAKRTGKPDPTIPDMAVVGKQLQGLALYGLLEVRDREPAYFGASVKPGDAHSVLMRWTLDGGDLRVIYGDLRTETVSSR